MMLQPTELPGPGPKQLLLLLLLLFKGFLYLFLERGRRRKERERNINVWLPLEHPLLGTLPTTQACALTGICTSDPLVHRPVLNPLSHSSQGRRRLLYVSFSLWVRIWTLPERLPGFELSLIFFLWEQ